MKIRVTYTVELDDDQVEELCTLAGDLGLPPRPTPRRQLAELFADQGLQLLAAAEAAAEAQRWKIQEEEKEVG